MTKGHIFFLFRETTESHDVVSEFPRHLPVLSSRRQCKNFVHGAWILCHPGKSQIYLKDGDFIIRLPYLKTNVDRT